MIESVMLRIKRCRDVDRMSSTRISIRIDAALMKRLEKLAKSVGRSRSSVAATAIAELVEANEWQVTGIKQAIASMDRGEGVAHDDVKQWVRSRDWRRMS